MTRRPIILAAAFLAIVASITGAYAQQNFATPNEELAFEQQAEDLLAARDFTRLKTEAEAWQSRFPDHFLGWHYLCRIGIGAPQFGENPAACERAAESGKLSSIYSQKAQNDLVDAGLLSLKAHKYEQARDLCGKAIAANIRRADLWVCVGDGYALPAIDRMTQFEMNSIKGNFASQQADDKKKQEEANRNALEKSVEAYKQANLIDDRQAIVWNSMGTVYMVMGKHADALPAFERAAALDEKTPNVWYSLGVCAYMTGDSERAKKIQEKAKAYPEQEQALKKFFTVMEAAGGGLETY